MVSSHLFNLEALCSNSPTSMLILIQRDKTIAPSERHIARSPFFLQGRYFLQKNDSVLHLFKCKRHLFMFCGRMSYDCCLSGRMPKLPWRCDGAAKPLKEEVEVDGWGQLTLTKTCHNLTQRPFLEQNDKQGLVAFSRLTEVKPTNILCFLSDWIYWIFFLFSSLVA